MRICKRLERMIIIVIAATIGSAQQRTEWVDSTGKTHPCTGEIVEKCWVEEFTFGAGGDGFKTTCTVLGVTKTWNVSYAAIPQSERSDFIHGTIGLAGLACGAGGATSLTSSAALSTFQQTVFTNVARPRMAAVAAVSSPAALSKQAAVPSAQTAPQSVEQGSQGESVIAPAAPSGGVGEVAPAAPGETSTESGKAVELTVARKEAGTRPSLPPNNVTTDLEWNVFKMNSSGGNNFALRAGYQRTLSNEKITLGGTLVINTLLLMDKLFFNNALNLSASYMLSETSSLERKLGGSVNTFMVADTFYGTPFGMSVVASFSDNWFVNQDNIVTYGGMVQQSFIGDSKTTLLTAGVLFGVPILERYALNPSCVLAYNALTIGKDGVVKPDNPFMLQPALTGSIYFTRLFTLDAGAKTSLFIKDYHDFILTVGATILF